MEKQTKIIRERFVRVVKKEVSRTAKAENDGKGCSRKGIAMRSENKSVIRGVICLIVSLLILGGLIAWNEWAGTRGPTGSEDDPFVTALLDEPTCTVFNCTVFVKTVFDPAAFDAVTPDERALIAAAVAETNIVGLPDGTYPMFHPEHVKQVILDQIERHGTTLEAVVARAREYMVAAIPASRMELTVRVTECITDQDDRRVKEELGFLGRTLTDLGLDPEKVERAILFTVACNPSADLDGIFRITGSEVDVETTFVYLYEGKWYLDPRNLDDDLLDVGMSDRIDLLETVTETGTVRWVNGDHFRVGDTVFRVTDPTALDGIEAGDSVRVERYRYAEMKAELLIEERDTVTALNAVSVEKN